MKSTTREGEAPECPFASADGAATTPTTVDGLSRRTELANRELRGCAREGCLEVAKIGSDRCPLHDWFRSETSASAHGRSSA